MTEFSLEKKGKKKEIEKSLIDKYFVAMKSRPLLSKAGRCDRTRFKNVFNTVVHYQLVRGIDGRKEREGIRKISK